MDGVAMSWDRWMKQTDGKQWLAMIECVVDYQSEYQSLKWGDNRQAHALVSKTSRQVENMCVPT